MHFRFKVAAVVGVSVVAMAGIATVALADNSGRFDTNLTGYEEISTLSTSGTGFLTARLSRDGGEIAYTLGYEGPFNANPTGGTVTQAHIHLGAPAFNGGISAFLCTNLDNGPVGTPRCPASGTVSGVISAPQVIGPTAQGISAGEFAELVRALRAGATYANVHTTTFPGGEIRGQISDNDEND